MSASSQAPTVLVIGAGMYVCGRGTNGYGTVLPTLVQAQRNGMIGEIVIAATSQESLAGLRKKLDQLNQRWGTRVTVRGYPMERATDPLAYRHALTDLPRPACAIVVVPDHLHARIAAEVIKAGVHVLLVKPLTPTVAEAKQLIELARAHQVYAAVDFHKRFDEANLLLRQALADGRLGALRHLRVAFSQRRQIRETFQSWIHATNIFQYLGVHYVDLIYFLTGATPVRVLATGQPRAAIREGLWRLDAIQAVIEWEERASGQAFASTILTSWIDPERTSAMSDQQLVAVGTRGRYESDQKRRGVQLVTDEAGVEEPNPYFSQLYQAPTGEPVIEGYGPRSLQQFLSDVRALLEGTCQVSDLQTTRPSFQEALISTAVVEAVNRSLGQGEAWVTIDELGEHAAAKPRRALASSRHRQRAAAVKR